MENKTSKYFKYAIGEILLVVIGILIAVQINTWNEHRKTKSNEIKTLTQLNVDLRENYKEITEIHELMLLSNKSGQQMLDHLNTSNQVTDSLKYWVESFSNTNIFNNANTTYKNLENSNDNIISNDSIRLQITLMYELDFANIHRREKMFYEDYLPNYQEELLKNFKTSPVVDKWLEDVKLAVNTPINLSNLKQNEAFKNTSVELYNFRLLRLKWLNGSIIKLETLIKTIDNEINTLKS
ncbi:DUF6090 family protein [Psychroserpens ponticola]|uniref:DUF6090 family protein n=1 Tax=Psychroserpens ponticola TaxID=2932268 RepID=A0ABY7RZZ5_9FLAO|nr:DUF6090 family protein [Psychroserpens ponticola]WCO02726.1 DUF6090 family protein [Psychroserpens ponticola]